MYVGMYVAISTSGRLMEPNKRLTTVAVGMKKTCAEKKQTKGKRMALFSSEKHY